MINQQTWTTATRYVGGESHNNNKGMDLSLGGFSYNGDNYHSHAIFHIVFNNCTKFYQFYQCKE